MKYRRLTQEELENFEDEFVQFLSANTITANDWQKLKQKTPEKAEDLIDMFSDIVMEKSLEKVQYLEHRSRNDVKFFECGEEKMILFGLRLDHEIPVDLTDDATIRQLSEEPQRLGDTLKVYRAEKAYKEERNKELFRMLEQGCRVSREDLFKTARELHQKT